MEDAMRLKDKTAIITGAASGIGAATARLFAGEGAHVTLVDRDAAGVTALAAELGERARPFVAEVTDEAHARACVEQCGSVDILVTAAGISLGKPALDTGVTDWNTVMAVNVTGTFLWIRECLRPMMAKGGSIVTIASQLARAGGRGNAAYVTSKGAVVALTKSVALDYVDKGIRCNAVLPGATETPLLRRSFGRQPDPEAARARSLARHPMGRFGDVRDIAAAALYLASDESAFVTGIELPVDGGWLAG
jgi:NAD(P)-dependent dehydrogenase (short-subunit alcohol dehydrogenase family)